MKHAFYSLGITSFLVCMIFSVTTSITNPFYGMSEAAVAQATTYTSTTGNSDGNYSYSINPYRYKVHIGEATITYETEHSNITTQGRVGLTYGLLNVNGKVTLNPVKTKNTISIQTDRAVNFIVGGFHECYKAPGLPTNFYR